MQADQGRQTNTQTKKQKTQTKNKQTHVSPFVRCDLTDRTRNLSFFSCSIAETCTQTFEPACTLFVKYSLINCEVYLKLSVTQDDRERMDSPIACFPCKTHLPPTSSGSSVEYDFLSNMKSKAKISRAIAAVSTL
jgi:hypothetical protein